MDERVIVWSVTMKGWKSICSGNENERVTIWIVGGVEEYVKQSMSENGRMSVWN